MLVGGYRFVVYRVGIVVVYKSQCEFQKRNTGTPQFYGPGEFGSLCRINRPTAFDVTDAVVADSTLGPFDRG